MSDVTSPGFGESEMKLEVSLYQAKGLENSRGKRYCVEFWVHRDLPCVASPTKGCPNPKWNKKLLVEVDRKRDCRFLYVEVVRVGELSDPGTSTGQAVVGRARIALPNLSNREGGRYELVRVEGGQKRPEGDIELSMDWKRITRYHSLRHGRSGEAPWAKRGRVKPETIYLD